MAKRKGAECSGAITWGLVLSLWSHFEHESMCLDYAALGSLRPGQLKRFCSDVTVGNTGRARIPEPRRHFLIPRVVVNKDVLRLR